MSQHESFPGMNPDDRNEYLAAYLQEQLRSEIEVFGEDRLMQTVGHEASPEATQELLSTIDTLCREGGSETHHFVFFRELQRSDSDHPLILVTGTYGRQMGFGGFGNMDYAQASVDNIVYTEKLGVQSNPTRRKLGIPKFKSFVREGMFVDGNGVAMVRREILTKRDDRSRVATKPATADELESVMTLLASAVAYDDTLHPKDA
jgi:hypothetical protein